MTDVDGLHSIPEHWTWSTLGDVARLVTGGTPPGKENGCYGGDLPFLKPTDLAAGRYVSEARQHLTPHGAGFLDVLPARTVLITCIGATIGKTGLSAVPSATNQQINAAIATRVEPEFLYYFVIGPTAQDWILANASATTLPILNKGRLATMPVPVPPEAEQKRLVAKLDALRARSQRARDALDAVLPLLEKLRQSILAAAFRGDLTKEWREKNPDVEPASELLKRIRVERRKKWEVAELAKLTAKGKAPTDDRWKAKYKEPAPVDASGLAELPALWCWASVDEVSQLQLGQQRAPLHANAEVTYPYIRAANITWDGLDLSDVKEMGFPDPARYLLEEGDVLLNEASGSASEVGKPAIWRNEILGCCYQKTLLRVRPVSTGAHSDWLHLCFLADALLGRFVRLAPGVGILHLTAERMLSWAVPLAPVQEQVRILRVARLALERVNTHEAQMGRLDVALRSLESSVLGTAFRGPTRQNKDS